MLRHENLLGMTTYILYTLTVFPFLNNNIIYFYLIWPEWNAFKLVGVKRGLPKCIYYSVDYVL